MARGILSLLGAGDRRYGADLRAGRATVAGLTGLDALPFAPPPRIALSDAEIAQARAHLATLPSHGVHAAEIDALFAGFRVPAAG